MQNQNRTFAMQTGEQHTRTEVEICRKACVPSALSAIWILNGGGGETMEYQVQLGSIKQEPMIQNTKIGIQILMTRTDPQLRDGYVLCTQKLSTSIPGLSGGLPETPEKLLSV